jgi:hypothetical protein
LRSSDVFLSQPDTANPNKAASAMATEVIRFIVVIAGSCLLEYLLWDWSRISGVFV